MKPIVFITFLLMACGLPELRIADSGTPEDAGTETGREDAQLPGDTQDAASEVASEDVVTPDVVSDAPQGEDVTPDVVAPPDVAPLCGVEGGACCHTSPVCGPALTCVSDGAGGATCRRNTTCGAGGINYGYRVDSGTAQPCCPGNVCLAGSICMNRDLYGTVCSPGSCAGACYLCGGLQQPCCMDNLGARTCAPGFTCHLSTNPAVEETGFCRP